MSIILILQASNFSTNYQIKVRYKINTYETFSLSQSQRFGKYIIFSPDPTNSMY